MPRATNVQEQLDGLGKLAAARETVRAIEEIDTAPIVAAIDEAEARAMAEAGAAIFPAGAPQSAVILYEGRRLRFNRVTSFIEPVEDVDPATILLRRPTAEEPGPATPDTPAPTDPAPPTDGVDAGDADPNPADPDPVTPVPDPDSDAPAPVAPAPGDATPPPPPVAPPTTAPVTPAA